jgi:hypothetical protein
MSSSPPLVWYRLVESDGSAFKGTSADAVTLAPGSIVVQFREAVKKKDKDDGDAAVLTGISPAQFIVFKNMASFVKRNDQNDAEGKPLKSSLPLDGLGVSEEEALIVVVPPPIPPYDFSNAKIKKRVDKLKNLLFFTNHHGCFNCATAYMKHRLVTFAHGPHADLKVGDELHVHSVAEHKFSASDTNKTEGIKVKVIHRSEQCDFLVLDSGDKKLYDFDDFACSAVCEGEEYLQLGLSALTQQEPFSVSRGIINSGNRNGNGHILGTSGSNPGESGGGCFSLKYDNFFGINVGCENLPISEMTTLRDLGTRYPARSYIVPSHSLPV